LGKVLERLEAWKETGQTEEFEFTMESLKIEGEIMKEAQPHSQK
jgi:hypothetical protein